jgi:hypothetical protein
MNKEELDKYSRQLGDKNIYTLPIEEARDYYKMRMRQRNKTITRSSKQSPTNVIVEAYIESIRFRKGIESSGPINLSDALQESIYKLYQHGVLPIRIGGIDKELKTKD